MSWVIQRRWPDETCVMGELLIDGIHECYTLEPQPPIPAGTYDLTIDHSQRFQRLMPHVLDVPGHEGIRIHWGNWRKDTQLCTLVGSTMGKGFVGHSVDEFNSIFNKLQDALGGENQPSTVTITYVDPPPFGNTTFGGGDV